MDSKPKTSNEPVHLDVDELLGFGQAAKVSAESVEHTEQLGRLFNKIGETAGKSPPREA